MAQEIAVFTPIPLPSNPAQLPSLPGWLQQRSAALGSAVQPDSNGKYREMAILPQSLILNSSERAEVERYIDDLDRFTRLDQPVTIRDVTMSNDAAIGATIAGLLIKGGGQKLDKASADALTEDYLDALEDLPAWSVREAMRKWNRGESQQLDRKPHDFNWKPTPATLRRLAQHELVGVKARMLKMQRILDAQPLVEYSDEYRENMLKRLQTVIRDAANPVEAGTLDQPAQAAE